MSVSCQKEITINVKGIPVPSAYWTYDEVGSVTRVDSIHALQQTVFSGSVPSSAGIIGNAAHFPVNASNNELFLTFPSGLNYSTGYTWTFWMKVAVYGAGFLSINFGFGNNSSVLFRYTGPTPDLVVIPDNNPTIHTSLGIQPAAVWQFFTVVYDSTIPAVTVTINRGTPKVVNLLAPFDPDTNGGFLVDSVDGLSDFLFDELGLWMNQVLPSATLDALFNAGAGQRPPFS